MLEPEPFGHEIDVRDLIIDSPNSGPLVQCHHINGSHWLNGQIGWNNQISRVSYGVIPCQFNKWYQLDHLRMWYNSREVLSKHPSASMRYFSLISAVVLALLILDWSAVGSVLSISRQWPTFIATSDLHIFSSITARVFKFSGFI